MKFILPVQISLLSIDDEENDEKSIEETETNKKQLNSIKIDKKYEYKFAEKKRGIEGKKCWVISNFAPLRIQPKTIIYHYNIDFSVQDRIRNAGDLRIPQKNKIKQQKKMIMALNFEIFNRFLEEEKKKESKSIFMSEPVFDGKQIIYSKTKLRIEDRITKEVKIKIPEKKFLTSFNVTITTPKESHLIDLSILNDTKNLRAAEKELQALDVIITYAAKKFNLFYNSNMFKKKSDLYNLSEEQRNSIRFDLSSFKEAGFGSYQACKLTENGTQLNVDRVAMVFNKGGKLMEIIEKFVIEKRAKQSIGSSSNPKSKTQTRSKDNKSEKQIKFDDKFKLNDNEFRILNFELKGLSFYVDHISYKPKNTIFALTRKSISELMINLNEKDGQRMTSVKDYFEAKYKDYMTKMGRDLLSNLPCVHAGTKQKPIYFPIEVVVIIDDQYSMKKLDNFLQSKMTKICGFQSPTNRFRENQNQIMNLIQSSKRCETDYLKYFNIELTTKFSEIEARILDAPSICASNEREKVLSSGEWRDTVFAKPAKLSTDFKWIFVNFTKEFNDDNRYTIGKNQVDELVDKIVNFSKFNGLMLGKPSNIRYNEVYLGKIKLEETIEDFMKRYSGLKLILFLIPDNDELYSQIKYLTEIHFGIVSQCISQAKNKKFFEKSYVPNLVLKINSKLGGIHTHIKSQSRIGFLRKRTMIIGLDVTHPAPHDRLNNSIATVVATFDNYYVNYYSKSVIQEPRKEIVDLENITLELLENFYLKNQNYPLYILVYRDGVSDGQFAKVIDCEINRMKSAFLVISQKMEKEYNPKVTFIIVQKRSHHIRFLCSNEKDRDKTENVKPGLVVSNLITHPVYHDFYLNSHKGLLGTSRPTRYVVLHDESGLTGDDIHKSTYFLSHLFPRCMKVISVPPPVLYAHLACKRARYYLAVLDNKRGEIFGDTALNSDEIKVLNNRIQVKEDLQNTLYFI